MTNDRLTQENTKNIAVMNEKLKNIECKITEISTMVTKLMEKIDDTFATKEELRPIRAIVYGLVTTVLLFVLNLLLGVLKV